MMVAQVAGLQPGEFVHTFGDLHLYQNHVDSRTASGTGELHERHVFRVAAGTAAK